MLFFGRYTHSLDDKSRLMLPTKLREKLSGTLFMTLGLGGCIYLYPEDTFMEICKERSKLNGLSREELGFKRTFFSNSNDCELDKQGRILIPKDLLRVASIIKDTIIVGNDDHVEIWDKSLYEQVELNNLENYENYAETIGRRLQGRED